MVKARFVRLEGLDSPCLMVATSDAIPDELVIDFGEAERESERNGPVTYRLQPSSRREREPEYVEIFDE